MPLPRALPGIGDDGDIKHAGPLAGGRVIGRIAGPAPRLGAHTAEIMDDIAESSDGEAADGH